MENNHGQVENKGKVLRNSSRNNRDFMFHPDTT